MRTRIKLLAAITAGALLLPALTSLPAASAPPSNPFVVNAETLPNGTGAAGAMDLTTYGELDWVHLTGTATERKAAVTPSITVDNLYPAAGQTTLGDSPVAFRWSDGTATPSASGITTGGVFNYDNSTVGDATAHEAGYRITVAPADSPRRLVFVGGVWQARGTVTVAAADGGGTAYTTKISASDSPAVKRYTVTIRPGEGVVVTTRFTEKLQAAGNVSLSAVALSRMAPVDGPGFTATAPPVSMDLAAEGPSDWLHLDGSTINRRAVVPAGTPRLAVANRQAGAAIGAQNDNPVTYSWTKGTPTDTQSGSRQGGIFFVDGSNPAMVGVDLTAPYGYDLTVPAAPSGRTVRFVSGAWRSTATVSVYLNGASAPAYVSSDLVSTGGSVTRLFELTLGAGDSARITAQVQRKIDASGNVTLAGVTQAETSATAYRDLTRALLDQIGAADLNAASEAARQQLDAEIASATALIADGTADRNELRLTHLLLKAAFDEAQASAAGAEYTNVTYPGLTSSFGWEGDLNAPIAFIDGSYRLRSRGNALITFGVPNVPGKIKWSNAEGYLPAFVSEYAKDGLQTKVENFADLVVIGGNRFEVAYSRMTVTNTTTAEGRLPRVSNLLTPLNAAAAPAVTTIGAGQTVVRDYAVAADRFGAAYDWPSAQQLQQAGALNKHYKNMRSYWNNRLAAIAQITKLPDERLVNAYKAGYIYTLIIRDDIDGAKRLHVGENGYDEMFDHDTIGIVATLLTIGDFSYAQEYLATLPAQLQYDDAKWKYSWPYALYLQRTGDKEFVRSKFETIKKNTHMIETDRIDGGKGIIKQTFAIDSLGYWTIDNWSALAGLTTYRYLATALGETQEAAWAKAEYDDLLRVATARIDQTMQQYDLDYLPISMIEPNETGPRKDPRDANWASMFLFGRWAWDGYLFGAEQTGTMFDKIDDTYTHGFDRRKDVSDTIYNFGGYPHGYFSSAYNAGYGSAALRGEKYRDLGIKGYQFMIDQAMSGPFGWWEGVDYPDAKSPWDVGHARGGGGSNQHMWGQSTNTKVLFDSLIAAKADGSLVIGRGVPDEWVRKNEKIAIDNYPVADGKRVGYRLTTSGRTVSIELTGDRVPGHSIELPALKNNVAGVSVKDAQVDEAAGTVFVPTGTTRVTITLRKEMPAAATR
ncbi:sugar-binding protein [Kribbella sp. CA-293567]|uniref:sugar-binding protein n=1 Tax=Kribbella sp. CA-293567 TaxID=3002436 RepID=UPI0022DD49C0|nr:sugar-binding protein [Kribbella sp. CA-293567]WBQ07947.1 sugar-binding protein [Kribbella sp. CA-293567]